MHGSHHEREDAFDDVVLDEPRRACDAAENELPDHGVINFVEIELVVDNLVERRTVGLVERLVDLSPRAAVAHPCDE